MKNTLVIARRELTEKRFVFLTAIAFAVLAMIVPFMPGVHASERRNALAMASLIFSTGFTVGLAAILGANIIGRELSDGRLSFYFSKPVSAASIWFGKLIAATLLIAVSFAIIALPASIAGIGGVVRTWTNLGESLPTIRIILAAALVLFLLGHVIGTFARSRSAWIVVDFVAATLCGIAIWLIMRSLLQGYAFGLTERLGRFLAIEAAIAIIAGGLWQVAKGRTDRKRSHIELSRFLWIALGSALVIIAGYAVWVESVSFADLVPESADHSPNGSWAIIGGRGRHREDYRASFLYDLRDNRAVRIPALNPYAAIQFSADERTFSWVTRTPNAPVGEFYVAKVDSKTPHAVATRIPATGNYALSDDGSRAAIVSSGRLVTIYDLATLSSLGSVRLAEGQYIVPLFITNDLMRIYVHGNGTKIFEYDVVKKTLRQTGVLPDAFRLNHDRTRAAAYWKRPAIEIYDARTGALLTKIDRRPTTVRFLDDGRIAAAKENALEIFSPDGALLRSIDLPKEIKYLVNAGGGRVVVVMLNQGRRPTSVLIDVDRGVVVRTEEGLLPEYAARGSQLLCQNIAKDLIVWDTVTGEKRVILKRS
ncbi:MAG TPA: ABC transporter permease [Thermoanaerobaculia bacterium]|nr:ABC transporter permease [Thermoanaerobaculia bacterium]